MCYICSVIKIKEDKKLISPIARTMFDEQDSNDDGTGAYCFNRKDNKVYYSRKMKEGFQDMIDSIENFDVVNYHFRNSTGGVVGEKNVHFWKIGKWLFAHNGTAGSFQAGEDCDSLGLFKKMVENKFLKDDGYINVGKIKEFINGSTFWGRFVLINSVNHKMYYFGDWKAYLVGRSYLVIASATSSFDNKETLSALGITFETEEDVEIEILESEIDGIFSFSPSKGFVMLDDKFKEWKYGGEVNLEKKDEKKEETMAEYYARTNGEYNDDDTYESRLKVIEDKFDNVVKKIGNDYTDENLKILDQAEIEHDIELSALNDEFIGVNRQLIKAI